MQQKPDRICVNEISSVVARRDHSNGRLGYGIVAFALSAIAERIIRIQSFDDAERFWFEVHAAQVPRRVDVRHRPLAPGESATINTFKTKLSALEGISLVTILCGTPTPTMRGVYDTPEQPVLMKLR